MLNLLNLAHQLLEVDLLLQLLVHVVVLVFGLLHLELACDLQVVQLELLQVLYILEPHS